MEGWAIAILTGGVAVAVINLFSARMARRDKVKDDDKATLERRSDAAAQIEELRQETAEQFGQVDGRIATVETKLDTVVTGMDAVRMSTKAQAYDRIRHLGLQYIRRGKIADDELQNLIDMHHAYQALGGDGFLDRIMQEVDKLPISAK